MSIFTALTRKDLDSEPIALDTGPTDNFHEASSQADLVLLREATLSDGWNSGTNEYVSSSGSGPAADVINAQNEATLSQIASIAALAQASAAKSKGDMLQGLMSVVYTLNSAANSALAAATAWARFLVNDAIRKLDVDNAMNEVSSEMFSAPEQDSKEDPK